mgnify:CR=1 FL=1
MFDARKGQITITRGDTGLLAIVPTGYVPTSQDRMFFMVAEMPDGRIVINKTVTPDDDGVCKLMFSGTDTENLSKRHRAYTYAIRFALDVTESNGKITGYREMITPEPPGCFVVLEANGCPACTCETQNVGSMEVKIESFRGPKGDKGETGPIGPQGPQGEKGDKGDRGEKGDTGPQGETGAKGDAFTFDDFTPEQLESLRGPKGDTGATGPQGTEGAVGPQGPQGAKGEPGKDAVIDATLTQEGEAADAKAAGEAISQLKEDLGDTNNKIFEYTAASPNVYDASRTETGKRIKSDGTIVSDSNQILSDFIMIPNGSKLVFTRGDTRQVSTFRITQLFATVMLWDTNKNPITSSYLTSVAEISNETGSDCYCRFSFSTKAEYIKQMAEIMPVGTQSTEALGLTQYYEYYPAHYSEKVKKSAVETDSIFDKTSDNPASGKAIADATKSSLFDKKIMFYGDSFTYDYDGAQNRYHTYIKARCGCETVIHGLIGSNITYKGDSSVLSMSDTKRLDELSEDVDMIVIFGGINDSRQIITSPNTYKIGTFEDVWDNESNTNTFYASLKHILDVLIARYPAKVIVGILPPVLNPNADRFGGYNQVCEAEIEVYKNYGIPYIDMRSKSTISNLDAHIALYNRNTNDVHWNNAGHERASYPIQIFLEQYMH